MNKLLPYLILLIVASGCGDSQNKKEFIGDWVEKIEIGPNTIPRIAPADWEADAEPNFYVTFSKDSITTKLYKTVRTTFWEMNDKGGISFPDEDNRAIYWKVVKLSDSLLIIERSRGGICPNPEILKFKKL